MYLKRAQRRSKKYFKGFCTVYRKGLEQDIYGAPITPRDEDIIYSGKCFASPGNMWPFEAGEAPIRAGRSDTIFYLPPEVDDIPGLDTDATISYRGHSFEVIGYASVHTAQASLGITARRVT